MFSHDVGPREQKERTFRYNIESTVHLNINELRERTMNTLHPRSRASALGIVSLAHTSGEDNAIHCVFTYLDVRSG